MVRMPKKSRKKSSKSSNLVGIKKCVETLGKHLARLVDWTNPSTAWCEWMELRRILEQLRAKQKKGLSWLDSARASPLAHLMEVHSQCIEEGNGRNVFEFSPSDSEGWGAIATCDVECHSEILIVPRKMMMTESTAIGSNSRISPLLQMVPFLRQAPTLVLALHLLSECFVDATKSPPSPWTAYCASLPSNSSLHIPLMWDDELFEKKMEGDENFLTFTLRGSSGFLPALKGLSTAAHHYHKLFTMLSKLPPTSDARKALPLNLFTWESFRWAMAIVITRQNKIPTQQLQLNEKESNEQLYKGELALTPVFDMINHEPGDVTTDFKWDTASGSLFLYAKRSFKKGEQIRMSYGARSSKDFLLSSGFVPKGGSEDGETVLVTFRIPQDSLAKLKKNFLSSIGIQCQGTGTDNDPFRCQFNIFPPPSLIDTSLLKDDVDNAFKIVDTQVPSDSKSAIGWLIRVASADKDSIASMMRERMGGKKEVCCEPIGRNKKALQYLHQTCIEICNGFSDSARKKLCILEEKENLKIREFRQMMALRLCQREHSICKSLMDATLFLLERFE
eukprot:g2335.t1